MKDDNNKKGLTSVGDIIRADSRLKPPSSIQIRLIEAAADIRLTAAEDISYQHTIFCQTGLPYRATDTRFWERKNGRITLNIEPGGPFTLRRRGSSICRCLSDPGLA